MNEERLYINGKQISLPIGQPIAKTLQINDIGSIADSQANFTRGIEIPKNPINVAALDYLGVIGNNSSVPYQKNEANYFVGNECLIYNGWATINESDNDSYKVNIYDGIIDFYKAIENDVLTDVGLSALNHTKTVTNVINSWTGTTDYRYIVADYNGKKVFQVSGGTTQDVINVDYLIPSANVKFIWDKIFNYYNFSYSGNVFQTEAFKNLWITYPKPVPSLVPTLNHVTTQGSILSGNTFDLMSYNIMIWQPFNTPEAEYLSWDNIKIKAGGSFKLKVSGTWDFSGLDGSVVWFLKRVVGGALTAVSGGTINGNIDESVIINCNIDDILVVTRFSYGTNAAEGSVTTYLDYVQGYQVDFSAVFLDFKVKDFINEILQRFSLTMFPDKYSNSITFLTTAEWLQNNNVLDWSDKSPKLFKTTYTLNGYAQKNRFKYRYNDDDAATYNDGIIEINNVNIPDEKTILNSRIYTPEKDRQTLLDFDTNVYRFWDKEVKDNGTVNYKPLENRFYFLRSQDQVFTTPVKIGSQLLNTVYDITSCKKESYSRLKFQDIISDYYDPIKNILNTSKIFHVDLNLSVKDINDFDFRKLVYIDQYGSYFLVNKISNFIPNRLTRCELIEVDNQDSLYPTTPTVPVVIATGITITNVAVDDCEITVTYTTDAPTGTTVNVVVQPNDFGVPPLFPYDPLYLFDTTTTTTVVGSGNTVTFTLDAGSYYTVQLSIFDTSIFVPVVSSNLAPFDNLLTCSINSPSGVTITAATFISTGFLSEDYQIGFTTDAVLPRRVYYAQYTTPSGFFGGWSSYTTAPNVTSNTFNVTLGTLFGAPSKVRIRIGNTVSNEFTI